MKLINRENIDHHIYFHTKILEKLVELRKINDEQDELEDDEVEELIDLNDFNLIHKNSKSNPTDN